MTFFAGSDPGGKRTHHVPLIGGLSPPRLLDRVVQKPIADFGCTFSLATSIRSAVRFMPIKAGAGHEQQGFNLVPETFL